MESQSFVQSQQDLPELTQSQQDLPELTFNDPTNNIPDVQVQIVDAPTNVEPLPSRRNRRRRKMNKPEAKNWDNSNTLMCLASLTIGFILGVSFRSL